MRFGFSKKKEELVLSLHIGSAAVGGALVRVDGSDTPNIIFSAIEPIAIEEKLNTEKFLSKTLQAVERVAEQVHKAALGAPSRIFCVLGSPWYASQMRVVQLKKNTSFIFTEKLADELIQKEIKLMSEEHASLYGNKENAIRAIELKNIKTTLNGYETSEPLGKKTREVEMVLFISIAGEKTLQKIEESIKKHFQFESIKFSSFAMASFTVVRDTNPAHDSFILVDVGGELTEILMVKKNVLHDSISYPAGRNFFTRSLAQDLGSTLSEARSLISLWKDGHAEERVAARIGETLGSLRSEWLRQFETSLGSISADISIPSRIFITADPILADFFAETIQKEQFSQYTLAEAKFDITVVDTKFLHNLAMFEDQATRDPFLILDSVYINRFLNKI